MHSLHANLDRSQLVGSLEAVNAMALSLVKGNASTD